MFHQEQFHCGEGDSLIAISEGVASKKDFSFGAIVGGGGGAVGIGAWQSTPQGKVIAGAFMDAFNQMVQATRGYAAQRTGPNGLGTGGALLLVARRRRKPPYDHSDSPQVSATTCAKGDGNVC